MPFEVRFSYTLIAPFCVLLAFLLIVTSSSRVHAAEVECFGPQDRYDGKSISDETAHKLWPLGFRPATGMCSNGLLYGTIEKGDLEKVKIFLRNQKNYLNVFYLISSGGNVNEGMAIGHLFRKFLIHSWAPSPFFGKFALGNYGANQPPLNRCEGDECICASACALIWFGAVDRTGTVGLHRPRISDPEFKSLPPAEAANVYRQVLHEMAQYLSEMEASRSIIDAMVGTGSSEIRWVDADRDRLQQPPSYAEWMQAICGQFSQQEQNTLHDLLIKKSAQNLTSNDTLLLNLLSSKEMDHRVCTLSLRFSSVEKLPPP
jgi:hypothetical protein